MKHLKEKIKELGKNYCCSCSHDPESFKSTPSNTVIGIHLRLFNLQVHIVEIYYSLQPKRDPTLNFQVLFRYFPVIVIIVCVCNY